MIGSSVDSRPALTVAFCAAQEASRQIESGLERWLTPAEAGQWRSMTAPKRRLDWAAARLAAKKALGESFEILSKASGQPYARSLSGGPAPHISLSHCAEGGACAASSRGPVGIDYEIVEEREPRVIELYAHPSERTLAADGETQTALWSLKEAVLKLLGLGLAGGLADVRFSSLREPKPELFGAAEAGWRELGRPALETSWKRQGRAVVALAFGKGA